MESTSDKKRTQCHPPQRTKADRTELLKALFGDGDVAKVWSNLDGDGAIEDFMVSTTDLEEIFRILGDRLAPRLRLASEQALKDPSKAGSLITPWITKDSPEKKLVELEQKLWLNERIVGVLMDHLGAHLALSMKLEALIRITREFMHERDRKVGKIIEDMAVEMVRKGLSAAAVQSMPKRDIALIVAYINDRGGSEGRAALEALLAGGKPDIEAEFRLHDETRARQEAERRDVIEAVLIDAPTPVMPVGFEAEWTVEKEPVPPEFWSQFQTFVSNYRWEYSEVNTSEEAAVAGMALPPADTYERLRSYRDDARFVPARPTTVSAVRKLVAVFLQHATGQHDSEPEEALMKAWMWLIHGRRLTAEECDRFYGEGFFDGVAMPCPATGPTVIRTLRRM